MTTFSELINHVANDISFREEIEWTNTWIDKANPPPYSTSYRILLIGDSTVRMVRSTLAKLACCPVDMIGTSSNIYDELFLNLIDAFFKDNIYRYNVIFVQLGNHGRISRYGGEYSKKDLEDYESDMRNFLLYLKQYSNRIILESIFDAVIPNKRWKRPLLRLGLLHEKKDPNINSITSKKSEVLKRLSEELTMEFLDINAYMDTMNFIHVDHIHFEQRAKKVIASKMLSILNARK